MALKAAPDGLFYHKEHSNTCPVTREIKTDATKIYGEQDTGLMLLTERRFTVHLEIDEPTSWTVTERAECHSMSRHASRATIRTPGSPNSKRIDRGSRLKSRSAICTFCSTMSEPSLGLTLST